MMKSLLTIALIFCLQFASIGRIAAEDRAVEFQAADLDLGRRLYMDGILPSGETISGFVRGDIELTGKQVVCGTCHRRSGMGSSEGDQVIPAVAGEVVFNPLRRPTTNTPLAPLLRPAYTEETLKQAIRSGMDANGDPLDPLMPRYPLTDEDLDLLIGYLKTISVDWSPGVTDKEIHFATVIAGDVAEPDRKALIDVMQTFVVQKNAETRHETFRAEHAPWHKKLIFTPYRKWVMHVWELNGSSDTWDVQLQQRYAERPVFALLSGIGEGSWQPVHNFCQSQRLPCLFPTTELPVIAEDDFYPLYLSKGMTLDGELAALHVRDLDAATPVVQVYRKGDLEAETAANGLIAARSGKPVTTIVWDRETSSPSETFWSELIDRQDNAVLVLWMRDEQLANFWPAFEKHGGATRVYLSSALYGEEPQGLPVSVQDRVFLTRTIAMPERAKRLLLRATGWLRMKKIYAPEAQEIQGNAYLGLKVMGEALMHIRGYFFRDYLVERIEHNVESTPFTSVYPRLSLAPEQRFAAKGGYITKFTGSGKRDLVAVTEWLVPH